MANPNIHCTIALFFLSGLSHLSGQVCGISGSKLNSSSGQVIDHQSLEFEIQYAFEKSVSVWDDNGTLNPLTGDGRKADIASSLFFRMTFGALRNTEIGATVDREAEEASLGIKWMPCRQGATSLAVAGGMKFGFKDGTPKNAFYGGPVILWYKTTPESEIEYSGVKVMTGPSARTTIVDVIPVEWGFEYYETPPPQILKIMSDNDIKLYY